MPLLLILSLIAQTGSQIHGTVPNITIDKPALSVTGQGRASISVKVSEYNIILYADTYAEDKQESKEAAESMRKAIIKATKELGGKEKDVILTNLNTLEPIEEDPYFRVEQDIQIWLKNVKDINRTKEKYLLIDGVQVGSVTPVIGETSDYAPAIVKARKDAIKNAKLEAKALASEMDVLLGEPIYITEDIIYPTYTGYEASNESEITVSVTIFYGMIYKK